MNYVLQNSNFITLATQIFLHTFFVKFCREIHYTWWENQELELQEWEY